MKSLKAPQFWFVVFLLVALMPGLVLENWQSFIQTSIPHVAPRHWGNDYRFFFGASCSIWNSDSPYADYFFTSPPFSAFLNLPLIWLIFEQAFPIFAGVTAGSCVIALWLLTKRLIFSTQAWCFCLLLAGLLCGLPFQFLISRGNTDGVVLLFVATAIFLISRFGVCSGILLGVAASLKLYPIILLLPLLAFRKLRVASAMIATILLLVVLTLPHWSPFLSRLSTRSQEFRIDENVSLVTALYSILSAWVTFGVIKLIAAMIFTSLLALQLFADWRKSGFIESDELAARMALYFPLMISVPSLVFNYEAVFVVAAVPAIVWLGLHRVSSTPSWVFVLMLVGAGLTQFQSILVFQLFGYGFSRFLPAWGLLILIASISIHQAVSLFGEKTASGVLE